MNLTRRLDKIEAAMKADPASSLRTDHAGPKLGMKSVVWPPRACWLVLPKNRLVIDFTHCE